MMTVPGPGESVCIPPFADWIELSGKRRCASPSLDELMGSWREEFVALAYARTASLGLAVPSVRPGGPLILSGHQPYLFHPGVLYKNILLARSAKAGALAVNISVDTDLCDGFPVKIPSYDGKYRKFTRYLSPSALKSFYVDVVSDSSVWAVLAGDVERDLASVPGNFFDDGKKFVREEFFSSLPNKTADAMTILRRKYLADFEGAVLEVPLSDICATKGYFEFAFGLFCDAERFADIFNSALREYRAEHKLRSSANPFPDLAKSDNGTETLFWLVRGGERKTLSVKNGPKPFLNTVGEAVEPASLKKLILENGWRLWPKAVALSMMNRLCLGDMFVHGLGGAKYDRITDEVIKGFYHAEPPPFATASLTLQSGNLPNPSEELAEMRQKLREMDFHPETYLVDPPADLLEEKTKLTHDIKIPGADKKGMGRRLGEINDALKGLLGPLKSELAERIGLLEAESNRHEVLTDRELPFFLFPPGLFNVG